MPVKPEVRLSVLRALPRQAGTWGMLRLCRLLGGQDRARVIVILSCVLALDTADKGTVGALVPELKHSLGITNTEVGALTAVSSGIGALAAIPVGMLTDRVNRVRLLTASIAAWSLAMGLSGLADSFTWLLLSRLALGAVTATAGPTLASLIGDYFPPSERARIYGFILTGEMAGAGFGLIVSGDLAGLLSWRYAFWFLALVGLGLLFVMIRWLHEPARGGQSRMKPSTPSGKPARNDSREQSSQYDQLAQKVIRQRDVQPDPNLMYDDSRAMSLWEAARYVLRIPTNRIMIVASAIGYFFFAGLRTFSVEFSTNHYDLSRATVSGLVPIIGLGALVGVLSGGRLADRLMRHGRPSARVSVPAVAYIIAAILFLPGLLTTTAVFAILVFTLAAGALAAANPPLDAARLDVVDYRLWGRAESIRTVLRMAAEAIAPLAFGFLADLLGGAGGGRASGLEYTFLIMLVPLVANGLILRRARRTYPRDVASAVASDNATTGSRGDGNA